MGCQKYSQVVVLFSTRISLKMRSSQGIFCEYMIRGTTAPVFNLTLALKNVTDSSTLLLLRRLQATETVLLTLWCTNMSLDVEKGTAFFILWLLKKVIFMKNLSWPCGREVAVKALESWFVNS